MEEFFTLKNGGQFAPAQRGQFTSAQRGQLQSAQRGQYHRLFQSDVYFEDPDTHLLIQVKNLGEINYGGGNYGITYQTGAWEGPFNWTAGTYGIEYLD